jgi:LysR family transcriptional regulator, chromosome initiation inhibitor
VVELTPSRHLDVPLYWQYWRMQSEVLTALTEAVKAVAAEVLR